MKRKQKDGFFGAPFDISSLDAQAIYASTLRLIRRAEKIRMEMLREMARLDQTIGQTIELLRIAFPEDPDQLAQKGFARLARAMMKIDRLSDESRRIVSIVMRLN